MPSKSTRNPIRAAVIGGSGVYDMPGMNVLDTFYPKTPFGSPSDPITIGEYQGVLCAFLPRHGKGHRFLPGEIPQRANFYALKLLGVEFVVAFSACGSLKQDLPPRHFLVPSQIIDNTKGRESTFFGDGIVAHISFAEPFSAGLSKLLVEAVRGLGLPVQEGGVYLCMEGPAFSTRAESRHYQKLGADVIGMTAIPEAKLAREAEMSYALLSMVTDFDSWKDNESVSIDMLVGHMAANSENAKKVIAALLPRLGVAANDQASALKHAIFTDPKAIPSSAKRKLKPIIEKYIR